MLGDGDLDCSDKVAGPFWGPIRGKIMKILINIQNILLLNHWLECIEIWCE